MISKLTIWFDRDWKKIEDFVEDHLAVITTDHFMDRMAAIHVEAYCGRS
ncbi:hypothetical protein AtNW77_Chr5g0143481 [Arabidopsis thaliana]|uniref:Eukaryotic translation initiation factor-like protein n=3 Tax=Arabidopsis TaxID=3701 RepID=Q9FKK8_ARATH|nr:eukaryotic translation initiation factor-like protein [Arabidopsis thaliana]AED96930.1 eukaryotic translation initiation factor-like protein [Arabidopsis thaliana]KAG7606443.1 hypothetical protein ISN45_At05g053560 [Arabidopsis thaliana x Arabidopsis arenosa]KAG7613359.1 hypothetical protein ISN44_As05g052820 [Arabidopsis suecica]BAB08801.1 unnamed protein product [Arabidopsis thaliana]|eukprot:NP_200573.1 eukaryotic translation initiation factor-like protein [Arabidopsis thaliana]